jgi:hypothetical protein
MSDEALAKVNRHLAEPPLIDFASSPLIGLLEAGRVARRHGIRVGLGHARHGGTDALVLLPETLLVHQTRRPAAPVEPLPIYDAVRADWRQVSYDDPATPQAVGALPRRTPMANLNDLLKEPTGTPMPDALGRRRPRSPEEIRSVLTSYQDGIRQARSHLQHAHADAGGA